MYIYLLRHGETAWNLEERLQGRTDIPLNATGKSQISYAATVLGQLNPVPELIISSPLTRARESAEIVSAQLSLPKSGIRIEPLLTERHFGAGEGMTLAERTARYPGDHYPGMEAIEDLLQRANSAFYNIVNTFSDRQSILLVSHGALLYAMLTAITEDRIPYAGSLTKFEQGSIRRIHYAAGKIQEIAKYKAQNQLFEKINYT